MLRFGYFFVFWQIVRTSVFSAVMAHSSCGIFCKNNSIFERVNDTKKFTIVDRVSKP